MRVKSGYLGVLTDELRRRGLVWGASRLLKYLALRGALFANRPWFGPFVAELSLTYRCQCKCHMCGLPTRHQADRTPLGLQEFKNLVDSLADMGTEVISLGGGEPLLFEDLESLVAAISRRGLVCKLNTTGSPLTPSLAENLVQAGLSAVAVSVDGATPQKHDGLRGRPGAFQQARQALEMFARARNTSRRRLRISTCSVLSERNLDQAAAICRKLKSWPADHMSFMPVQRSSGVEYRPAQPQALRQTLGRLAREPKVDLSDAYLKLLLDDNRSKPCAAGLLTCVTDCYGEVYPCEAWYAEGRSVGNIGDAGFRALWTGGGYREVRRQLRNCRACSWDCQMELNEFF